MVLRGGVGACLRVGLLLVVQVLHGEGRSARWLAVAGEVIIGWLLALVIESIKVILSTSLGSSIGGRLLERCGYLCTCVVRRGI